MGLRIPQNQTITSKYTSGGEYMIANTQNEYKGYYYELNNRTYAGENFNTNNPEIIKINSDNYNKLLGNPNTYAYGVVSGVKILNTKILSLPEGAGNDIQHVPEDIPGKEEPLFYCKKINTNIIKKINEETFISLQKDPIYQTTFIGTYNNKTQTPDDAEKQISGIREWVTSDIKGSNT